MRYLGIIIVLIGVAVLAMYYLGIFNSNAALATGGLFMVLGCVAYVFLNKMYLED